MSNEIRAGRSKRETGLRDCHWAVGPGHRPKAGDRSQFRPLSTCGRRRRGSHRRDHRVAPSWTRTPATSTSSWPAASNCVLLVRELRIQDYDGSYTLLKNFVQPLRRRRQPVATMRFETAPGDQARVDWRVFRYQTLEDRIPHSYWPRSSQVGRRPRAPRRQWSALEYQEKSATRMGHQPAVQTTASTTSGCIFAAGPSLSLARTVRASRPQGRQDGLHTYALHDPRVESGDGAS